MTRTASMLLLAMAAPLYAALLRQPGMVRRGTSCAPASLQMCAVQRAAVDVESVARDVRTRLHLELVGAFLDATERGDAAACLELCTDDFYYKTHRAATDSLAAAEERLHTKVPAPSKVTMELHEESPGTYMREIVVKPIPFVTVAVQQHFEVRAIDGGGVRLCRAEYIKQ